MNIVFALALYSAIPLSSAGDSTPLPEVAVVGPTVRLGDFNGDGLPDAYIVHPVSGDRLLRNQGDGTFADVTEQSGLSGIRASRMALWQDYDRDGALDLFVCSAAGKSRLMRNLGNGSFADATHAAGIAHVAQSDLWAEWIDYDGDRLPDLHIVTDRGDRIYHNCGGGSFELADLHMQEAVVSQVLVPVDTTLPEPAGIGTTSSQRSLGTRDPGEQGRDLGLTVPTKITPAGPHSPATATNCFPSLTDQAVPTACLQASSTPMLGTLHPLSINLNVSGAGNVGIGTTTPTAKLDVTGAVRASGQITSTVAMGTAPLVVGSTTKVNNLNADQIDGVDSSVFSQLGNSIESSEITDLTLVDADVFAGAGIQGTKITPNFGSQNIATTGTVGIGTAAPEGPLHVFQGSAGTVTANPFASAVFERSTSNYIQMLAPDSNETGLLFGGPTGVTRAEIAYTGGFGGALQFRKDGAPMLTLHHFTLGTLAGIGTSSPGAVLHTYNSTLNPTAIFQQNGNANEILLRNQSTNSQSIIFDYPNAGERGGIYYSVGGLLDMQFKTASSTRLTIDSTGNVGIGTTAPGNPIHVSSSGTALGGVIGFPQVVGHFTQTTSNQDGAISIDAPAGQDSILYLAENGAAVWDLRNDASSSDDLRINHLGATTVMTLETTGNVGIGTTSPGFLLHVNGTAGKPGGGTWTAVSDERLKKNVADVRGALEKLLALRGVTFEYIDAGSIGELEGQRLGMIAQEVEKVMPDWVETGPDGYKRLTVRGFEALTVEAFRELRAEKDRELAERDDKIADLERRLIALEALAAPR